MTVEQLAQGIRAQDRGTLARALTLVESQLATHRQQARQLLKLLGSPAQPGQRIGVTGPPGAGKSTLIESLGLLALEKGERVGVLAIDPSSQKTGGSILGDKTRMEQLSRQPQAYVRPSPASGALGGVARRTREAILLLEAAGYTSIWVETVGVGQSEVAVASLVDTVLLVALPGAGDDLQGMKRGLMETADLVWVNKADSERMPAARLTANQMSLALRLLPSRTDRWTAPVLQGSALERQGLDDLWDKLRSHFAHLLAEGGLQQMRHQQSLYWLSRGLEDRLLRNFLAQPEQAKAWDAAQARVAQGLSTPDEALDQLLGG